MDQVLAQRILDIIYRDPSVRRTHKDSISDWILDTQARAAPLSASALLTYLAAHQVDVIERLRINIHIGDDVARALGSAIHN
ncbi:MAG TPA: hypothetical protein VMD08_14505 [Candidatus Baltobacteraceae bacterium]|nr:hypothetical protein [Candidatus Baltobacteraceae bacterium]